MSTEIAIIQQENVQLIVQSAPQAFAENKESHGKCLAAGRSLLERIERDGMTDELDKEAATFIERSRKTVKKMNDKRSPVTKLFDEIRTQYTQLENEVDASKRDTIPYKLQQLRNDFAAKKRAEEESRRQEELRRQQAKQQRIQYRNDCEEDYTASFNRTLNAALNQITLLNRDVTLANYDSQYDAIATFDVVFPQNWSATVASSVILPADIPHDELKLIRQTALSSLMPRFREQYQFELESTRDTFLSMLPSKKQELEKAAAASAAEAARIQDEIRKREAEEEQRREEERKRKETETKQAVEVKKQADEIGGLFGAAQASVAAYQPKASVRKKLVPVNAEAFPLIISMWWTDVGCKLSIDELSKEFKKQVAYCEKRANASDTTFLESEHIRYEDEVKAK